ncbi:hypothetical protein PENTCL1PPCAC_20931, partial [Pristionchus entomophagus]
NRVVLVRLRPRTEKEAKLHPGWREANALKELTSIAMISYCELHDDEYINVSEELKKKISDMKTELQNEKK